MPTYEYLCTSCQNQWEEIQKISEPALTTCPKCKEESARRQISGGNFILKGGGWYADLYSSSPKPKTGGGEAGGESSSTASEPKTETPKTDTKSDAKTSSSSTTTSTSSSAPVAAAAASK